MLKRYPFHALMLIFILAGWTYLSFFNELMDDDLVMLGWLKEKGIWGATIYQYETWNTRWMSFLYLHTWMYSINTKEALLPIYHITTLSVLFFAFYRLRNGLEKKELIASTNNVFERLFHTGLLCAALITSTYHIGDTWFWMNTSTMYGWNLIAILFAMGITIMPISSPTLQLISMLLCGLYTGGAAEPAVAGIICIGIALFLTNKKAIQQYMKLVLPFIVGMTISFSIALAGEGHVRRSGALPEPGLIDLIWKGAWFSLKIAMAHSPIRILLLIILLFPLFVTGSQSKKVNLKRNLVISIAAWLIVVIPHTYFIVMIMGDYGPARAWSFISLWTMIVIAWLLSRTGYAIIDSLMAAGKWVLVAAMIYGGFMMVDVPEYSRYLKEIKEKKKTYVTDEVPPSGFLHRIGGEQTEQ